MGVKLFVLYLIMGVGVSIAARWVPVIERGGFSPIPFFYVMGGSLVFLFLTWHIPSVAGSMMAGAVSLSLADALVPGAMATRASGAFVHSGAILGGLALTTGRWGAGRLRGATGIHTPTPFKDSGGATGGGTGIGPTLATRPDSPPGVTPGTGRTAEPSGTRPLRVDGDPPADPGRQRNSSGPTTSREHRTADSPTPPNSTMSL